MTRKVILSVVCTVILLASSMGLWAGSQANLTITATSGSLNATWTKAISVGSSYSLASPYDLVSQNGTKLGTLKSVNASAMGDPVLTLAFSVINAANVPIVFSISNTLPGLNIPNPECAFSAAFTVTDGSDPANGATATGNFGGLLYQAKTNNGIFVNLLPTINANPGASNSENGQFPANGFVSGGAGIVTSMTIESNFTLTGNDLASGTARFECRPAGVVPEPMSVMLGMLGLSGVAGYVRMRKRA